MNKDVNSSLIDNPGEKSPVVARSVKSDFENDNLATKLDYIITEFQTIEKTLKYIQDTNKKTRLVNC